MSVDDNKLEISYVPDDSDFGDDESIQKKPDDLKTNLNKNPHRKPTSKTKIQEKVIEKLTRERDDFKDKFMRNLAEIDNFRKRIQKEKEEYQKYALGNFLKELLLITDNLERALKVKEAEAGTDSIISGVEMIYRQLMDILMKNGVNEIEALNSSFDPNVHQALSKEESEEVSGPTIIEIYQKGFMYNDKLLRPTLAKVAVPPETKTKDDNQEE